MSLRVFHVLFIALSVVLSAMVAAWGIQQYLSFGETSGLVLAVAFFVVGIGLVIYGTRYFHKLKELG